MTTTKMLLAFAALTLVFVGLIYLPDLVSAPFIYRACKVNAEPVVYKRLSSEKSDPFMVLGRPLSEREGHPDYKMLRNAVNMFPDVQSCLVESERGAYSPNLT